MRYNLVLTCGRFASHARHSLLKRCPLPQASAAEWGSRLAAAEEQLGALKAGAEAADSDEEEDVDAARLEELEELAQRLPGLEAHTARLEAAIAELQAAKVTRLACRRRFVCRRLTTHAAPVVDSKVAHETPQL